MFLKVTHPELIVLDFDHTIFNTTKYVTAAQEFFEKQFGISAEEFIKQREAVKDCCVVIDIDTFVARLPNKDKDGMHAGLLHLLHERAGDFTFSDALPFVERHQVDFDMVLLTRGDEELQSAKIRYSGLPEGIPRVITKDLKSGVLKPYVDDYRQIHFIDDKPSNIEDVKGNFPTVRVYFMKRPEDMPYGDSEPKCACEHQEVTGLDFTIESVT